MLAAMQRLLSVGKAILASILGIFCVYSLVGIFGGADLPMFRWSAWWYPRRIFPGAGRDFEDHLLNLLIFGAGLLVWRGRWATSRGRRERGA